MSIYEAGKSSGVRYPHAFVPLCGLIGGVVVIVVAILSLGSAIDVGKTLLDAGIATAFSGDASYFFENLAYRLGIRNFNDIAYGILYLSLLLAIAIYLFSFLAFAIRIFGFGMRQIGSALNAWFNRGVLEGVPTNLPYPQGIAEILQERRRSGSGFPVGPATTLLGLNAQFISPTAMVLAKPAFDFLTRHIVKSALKLVVMVAGVCALFYWLQASHGSELIDAIARILRAIGLQASLETLGAALVLWLAVRIAIYALNYALLRMATPKGSPSADAEDVSERLVVAESPYLIFKRFGEALRKISRASGPSHLYALGNEQAAASVGDTGNFDIQGVYELNPEETTNPNLRLAKFWMVSGWLLIVAGCIILLVLQLPSDLRQILTNQQIAKPVAFLSPIFQAIMIATGYSAFKSGMRMVASARNLFDSYWFATPTIAFRIIGTTTKSEVSVGKAVTDSVGGTTIGYQSSLLFNAVASELYAEVAQPTAARVHIGMKMTDEVRALLQRALGEMRQIAATKATTVPIDIDDSSMQKTVELNIKIDAARAAATEDARLIAAQRREDEKRLQAPPGSDSILPPP